MRLQEKRNGALKELQYRRVRVPLRGIWSDGQPGVVTIPKRAILRIAEVVEDNGNRLVPAFVGDCKILFYAQDLIERTAVLKTYRPR